MIPDEDLARAATISYVVKRMNDLGLNQRSLALRAGCKEDAVRNLLSGKSRNWRGDTQSKIMAVLNQNRVAILGEIGAADTVDLVENFDTIIKNPPEAAKLLECETFLVPSELSHRVVHAWRVKVGWEGPLLQPGDMVWTTEIRYENFDDIIDSEVLVRLKTGHTLIKRLVAGSKPSAYSLMGVSTHGYMRDVEILWCAQIAGHIKKLSL